MLYRILVTIVSTIFLSLSITAQLELDADGWTIIEPSPDSRIIYVSSSEGDDNNDGLSPENAIASLTQARNLARDGFPDHILLKAGDSWTTEFGFGNFKSGRSASEPLVVSYYGESKERPLVNCEDGFIKVFNTNRSHLAFIGIEFYAFRHDPTTPLFEKTARQDAFVWEFAKGENILIEDCKFNYMQLGVFSGDNSSDAPIKNIKLRRNIAVQSWAANSYFEHILENRTQGVYLSGVDGILIEDNLFDHNGWNGMVPGAGPNKFNHNIYMQYDNPNPEKIIVRNNIIARGAAHGCQLRSGGLVEDNLFIQNSVNLNIGYNSGEPISDASGIVKRNAFTEARLMDSIEATQNELRSLAVWGINEITLPSVITDNIFVHALNSAGVTIGGYNDLYNLGGSLELNNNIEFQWKVLNEEANAAWFDPHRMIRDYHRTVGGEGSTEGFLLAARERPLRTIWNDYEAKTVNEFMFRGFETDIIDAEKPLAPDTIYIRTLSGNFAVIQWSWGFDNERTVAYNGVINDETLPKRITEDYIILKNLDPMTEYTFSVQSVDQSGNESDDFRSITFMTTENDITPPAEIENLNVLDITNHLIEIEWSPSTDDLLLEGYEIYLNQEYYKSLPAEQLTLIIDDLEEALNYTIGVLAIDVAGNKSETVEISAKTLDLTPPSVPEVKTATISNNLLLTASWTKAVDNDNISHYNVILNGNQGDEPLLTTEDTLISIQLEVEEENYRVRVSAVDVSGNESNLSRPLTAELISSGTELVLNDLKIFPNPASDVLFVNIYNENAHIDLLNVKGHKIISNFFCPMECFIDVKGLDAGTYILKFENKEGKSTVRKFLKK